MTENFTLFDNILNVFLYYRLGSTYRLEENCMYCKLDESNKIIENRKLQPLSKLPIQDKSYVRVVCISDTHDRTNLVSGLPEGDIFIHCGDILMTSRKFSDAAVLFKYQQFNEWLKTVPCAEKYIVGGNHDQYLQKIGTQEAKNVLSNGVYVENEMIESSATGLRLFASPSSRGESGNSAFQNKECLRDALLNCGTKTNSPIDVLITHGSCDALVEDCAPRVHFYGHYHGSYGLKERSITVAKESDGGKAVTYASICASMMNCKYELKNAPIVCDVYSHSLPSAKI